MSERSRPLRLRHGRDSPFVRQDTIAATVSRSFLACSVRRCGLPLERGTRVVVCPRGHSYDVARSGYLNLLQPQDRRSRSAGDSAAAFQARARLYAAGVGRTVVDRFVTSAAALELGTEPVVVDLGSGAGDALAALAETRSIAGVGVDLSTAAAEHAASRFPSHTWIVANADRRLPLLDGSVDLVMSLHSRRNPQECRRVLIPAGFLLVAVPARDDLIELRALVQGEGTERERADAVLADHGALFKLIARSTVREQRHLVREHLLDLLRGTYRGARTAAADRIAGLESLDVTLASDVLLFARR